MNHIKDKIPEKALALAIINYCINIRSSTNKTKSKNTVITKFCCKNSASSFKQTEMAERLTEIYNDTRLLIHESIQGVYPHEITKRTCTQTGQEMQIQGKYGAI